MGVCGCLRFRALTVSGLIVMSVDKKCIGNRFDNCSVALSNFPNKNAKIFDGSWFFNVKMYCFSLSLYYLS